MNKIKAIGVSALVAGTFMIAMAMWNQPKALADDAPGARPHLDLAFCIDTTGSMSGEIEMVKTKTKEMVAKLAAGKPAPVVRVGLVAYRDRGDEYVTRVFQFTEDIDKVVKDISNLKADGGGDSPEAVNEALHAALNELTWDKSKKTAKLLFLIGDAEPSIYPNDYKWEDEAKSAISRGIQINTIGCDGLDTNGTQVFEKIAKLSDGRYETLAYRQEVVNAKGEKETYFTAGGTSYRLKKGAESHWKAGADLAARGLAEVVAAPRSRAVRMGGFAGMAGSPTAAGAGMAAGAPVAESAFMAESAAVNRADNNLDDVMLNAAKSKMTKDTDVKYSK